MPPTRISFVRHGHVSNPRNVYYGRLPGFKLSEEGTLQARLASGKLQNREVCVVYSSPLLRARQTARIISASHPHAGFHLTELISEVRSPFDGCSRSEVEDRHWDVYTGVPPGFEQPADVFHRAKAFVNKVRRQYTGGHIVAVTHGDLIAFLILWAKEQSIDVKLKEDLRPFGLADRYPAPASISTMMFNTGDDQEVPSIEYSSSTSSP